MDTTKDITHLEDMFRDLEKCSSLYRPSKFWIRLNSQHRDQLQTSGLKNFKRSVNRKYFNWGLLGIIAHGLTPIIYSLLHGSFFTLRKGQFENYHKNGSEGLEYFSSLTAYLYKIYVCSLFDYVSLTDKSGVLRKLSEPGVGNPFCIRYKGRSVSQDLCNSAHEFNSICSSIDSLKIKNILEIGAGYGRLAFIFLKMSPHVTYTIVDIPPALYVAEWYLTKVFAKEKIFHYRKFTSYKQIKSEYESSRIRFLMADQIKLLPKKYFDLSLNISSLHEMGRNQIKSYLVQIDRVSGGHFYTKQWNRSITSDNSYIKQHEYPIPKNWELVYSRYPHPIQRWFFDALYKIN